LTKTEAGVAVTDQITGNADLQRASPDLADVPVLDLFGAEYAADPAGTVRRLRGERGLARSVRGIEVLTYERAKQLLAHPHVAALCVLAARIDDVQVAADVTWSAPADALAGLMSLPLHLQPR
jgi:hypothetical protein